MLNPRTPAKLPVVPLDSIPEVDIDIEELDAALDSIEHTTQEASLAAPPAAEEAREPERASQDSTEQVVFTPEEVDRLCEERSEVPMLIESFLPRQTVNIAAGESTIGKSALVCQLALSVASGKPFLNMPTNQGRVLYLDLENPIEDHRMMRDALVRHLKLKRAPDNFLAVFDTITTVQLIKEIVTFEPVLVVIDSLRAFDPEMSEKNSRAGERLKSVRKLARKYGCAFLFVHHLRKPSELRKLPNIEFDSVQVCLREMEGASALTNQTDVRIFSDSPDDGRSSNPAALRFKWTRRLHGDSPLIQLERIHDDDGEPIGYRQIAGLQMLNEKERAVFQGLPKRFTTAIAQTALGLTDGPTNKFLQKCRTYQLVRKISRGLYEKVE